MSSESPHLSSLDFDILNLGHLDSDEAASLRGHLDGCSACAAQQKARLALADQFAREVLPRSLPVLRKRLLPGPRRRLGWWGLVLSPVACGVLVALLLLRKGPDSAPAPSPTVEVADDFGVKGGGALLTYVRQGKQVTRLQPGRVVAAGDALRFVVATGENRFLLIAGVDGGGHASVYHPFGEWRSVPVNPHGRFEVPGSVVLDDAPGPERIFAFLSSRPLAGARARPLLEALALRGPQAIRATAALDLPEAEVLSVLIEKRE